MFAVVPRKTIIAMTLDLPRLVKTKSSLQATLDCRQIEIIRLPPDQYKYTDEIAGEQYIPSICELSSNIYELLSESLPSY